jgi:hypothetical protein
MTFFYSFTDSLKSKWLQFFQVNRDWIKLHMEVESVYTPDGGKRPPSYLILGVVNALEPKLAQLMLPFSRLNADADTLVEVLGLHFDPDVALGNSVRSYSASIESGDDDTKYVMDAVRHEEEAPQDFSPEVDMVQDTMYANDSTTFQMPEESENGAANFSAAAFETSEVEAVEDAFGDISFDDLKDSQAAYSAGEAEGNMDEQMFGDIDASEDDAFNDVIRDVWSEETSSHHHGEANNQFGEEMSTDAIDNMEVAEIFSHN